jgi:uncharacterized protein
MTPAPIHFLSERLMLDPAGAVWWPAAHLLVVSDLHLEKGSAFARKGMLLPPFDTHVTIDRLTLLLRRWQPRTVVALGDSFHDASGATRLGSGQADRLRAITGSVRFIWVQGNHDPAPPGGLGGEWCECFSAGPFTFRHQAQAHAGMASSAGIITPRPAFPPVEVASAGHVSLQTIGG